MSILYKYYSNENRCYSIKNLRNGLISFSSLETLNDPYEGAGNFVSKVDEEEAAYWNAVGINLPEKVGQIIIEKQRDVFNFEYRVFCAAKEFDRQTMWAHYANAHQGFCVGYDQESIVKLSYDARDVVYGENMPDLSEVNETTAIDLLFHKAIDWQTEKEFRALYRLEEKEISNSEEYHVISSKDKLYRLAGYASVGNLHIECSSKYILKACKPVSIYLGLRTPEDTRNELLDIAEKHGIPIYQMVQEKNQYRLSCIEVNKQEIENMRKFL